MKTTMKQLFFLLLLATANSSAQVNIGSTATPHVSAMLEVVSTQKGLLPPRMTEVQRNAIAVPAAGLTIYNTTEKCLNFYNGNGWASFCNDKVYLDPSTNGTGIVTSYDCDTGASTGTLTVGTPATDVTKVIVATVTQAGTYNIVAAANGVTYSASGIFLATGVQNITLTATGTPNASGTDVSFVLNTTPSCNFAKDITSPSTNGTGAVSAYSCTAGASLGTLTEGVPASGVTKVIRATVTQLGDYNISATANGVTYSASGTFLATGFQNITLTATGTPTASGISVAFTLNTTPSCSFNKAIAGPNNFTTDAPIYNGISVINTQGVGYYDLPLPAASTIQLKVNVNKLEAYNLTGSITISTESTLAGLDFAIAPQTLTYSASGTFTVLGDQWITFTSNSLTPKWYGVRNITISGTGVYNSKAILPRIDIKTLPASSTALVPVTSSSQVWMDRNLGAHRAARAINDPLSYGSYYQFGRRSDGHELFVRNGNTPNTSSAMGAGFYGTTTTLSSTDTPGVEFIDAYDTTSKSWRDPRNVNLWQGVSGANNPCPAGYRVANGSEWTTQRNAWSSKSIEGAFSSPLKVPAAGSRIIRGSNSGLVGEGYNYWSSTTGSTSSAWHTAEVYFANLSFYPDGGGAFNPLGLTATVRCMRN